MKIETHTTTVRTSISAEAVSLGIDLAGMNHVMSILSNLYSDAPLAVLREYSANARDSHVEAGNQNPIEVTSPTEILPQLTIQDYGIGLSSDDIKNVYTRYGSSTKRDSNEQIGTFGIGSKSAFTISSQFTVTGVHSGARTIVLFSLTEDSTPIYQVLSRDFVDAPNQVKIAVPITDVDRMNKTIRSFFYTWSPGTVLVDGKQPLNLWTDPLVLSLRPDIHLRVADTSLPTHERQTSLQLVMGGVAYKAVSRLPRVHRGATIYVEVPIGAVDIAPSREALKDTDRTKTVVTQAVDDFEASVKLSEEADIVATTDPTKAVWQMRRWGELKGIDGSHNWSNQETLWNLKAIGPAPALINTDLLVFNQNGTALKPKDIRRFLVVTGCDTPNKARLVYNRGEKWSKAFEMQNTILVPAISKSATIDWFSFGEGAIPTKEFKEFKAEAAALYKTTRSGMARGLVYDSKIGQEKPEATTLEALLDDCRGRLIVLLHSGESWLTFLDDNYVQVKLSTRQTVGAAKKRLPGPFVERSTLLQQESDRKLATLSSFDKDAMATTRAARQRLRPDGRKILTKMGPLRRPQIADIVARLQHFETLPSDLHNLPLDADIVKKADQAVRKMADDYPLLNVINLPYNSELLPFIKALETYLNA